MPRTLSQVLTEKLLAHQDGSQAAACPDVREHARRSGVFTIRATSGEEAMRPVLILAALAGLVFAAVPAGAQSPVSSNTVAGQVPPKPPLKLTDAQKQRVAQAINGKDTLVKLPEGFTPVIDAKVPSQKKLPEHPLPRPLVYEIPALRNYYYVQLDDKVLIVDPMTEKVAEIVRR